MTVELETALPLVGYSVLPDERVDRIAQDLADGKPTPLDDIRYLLRVLQYRTLRLDLANLAIAALEMELQTACVDPPTPRGDVEPKRHGAGSVPKGR